MRMVEGRWRDGSGLDESVSVGRGLVRHADCVVEGLSGMCVVQVRPFWSLLDGWECSDGFQRGCTPL